MISYNDALRLTLEHIEPLEGEIVTLVAAVDRTVSIDLSGQADSPSVDISLKDGYAVHSKDIAAACAETPAPLQVIGMIAAGGMWQKQIGSGKAVRILSGAPVPGDTDAIIAEEFTQLVGEMLHVTKDAHPGRNILAKGSDVRCGELLVQKGCQLNPTTIGLLAAAGYQEVPVVRLPRVAILATGDEVVAPGKPLLPGRLYASNLVTLAGWCARYGFAVATFVAHDDAQVIREKLATCLRDYDTILTSGGAWSGERDLVVHILDELGWEKIYHRVRIGPGKAVAFGKLTGKPVFCLPGGPPSNHMAFLQLALPGLRKMSGVQGSGLPVRKMQLAEALSGQSDWTQFVHGRLEETSDLPLFFPLKLPGRLQMMAAADAIMKIPEGQSFIQQGQIVDGQVLA